MLGRPRILRHGTELQFRTQRARDIVLYIALEGPVSRAAIGQEFWTDLAPETQRKRVRQELVYARKSLKTAITEAGGRLSVVGARISGGWDQIEPAKMPEAIDHGFLAGLDYPWARALRQQWEQKLMERGIQLAVRLVKESPGQALTFLEALGRLDPYLERIPLLKAEAWKAQCSPVRARAAIVQYADFIKKELNLDVACELLELCGWTSDTKSDESDYDYGALSPVQRAKLVLAEAPGWLSRSQSQVGRTRLRLTLDQPHLTPFLRSELLYWLSRLASEAGDLSDALEHAQALTKAARNRRHVALSRLAMARALFGGVPFGEIRAHCLAVFAMGRLLEPEFVAEAHALLGSALYFENALEDAGREAKLALRISVHACLPFQELLAVSLQGSILFKAGKFERAQSCFERACDLGKKHGIGVRTGLALANLGRAHEATGNAREAERCYLDAQTFFEGREARAMKPIVLTYLGDLRFGAGNAQAALLAHSQALAERRLCGDSRGIATSARCLARCHIALGRYPDAERRLQQSLALAAACADEFGIVMNEAVMAHLRRAQGRIPEAAAYANRALATLAAKPEMAPIPGTENPIYTLNGIRTLARDLEGLLKTGSSGRSRNQ